MREHVSDIDLPPVEMHRGNQTILVAADIKDDEIADFISRRKDRTQVLKTTKVTLVHNFEPPRQRCFTVGVTLPELSEHFARNNVHS
jgi:hypothetical protein